MLAQLGHGPSFNRLPRAPMLPHLFLENPWPVAGVLVAAALVCWHWLRGRTQRWPAVGLLTGLGGAVVLLASRVVTTREMLAAQTRRLIGAVASADHRTVRELTAEGGYARAYGRWEREAFIAMIEEAAARGGQYSVGGATFRVAEYAIREVRAHVETPTIAKTQVNVTGRADEGPGTPTWWELDWDREQDGVWRVRSIRLLWDLFGGNHKDR
ncbi:MAG: hypothetical protein IT439_06390 [Phycisphaerales bacterium]|nr:hypothetical protein [Phycisphaerales bacterium]